MSRLKLLVKCLAILSLSGSLNPANLAQQRCWRQTSMGFYLWRAPSLVNIRIPQTPANRCQLTSSMSDPCGRFQFLIYDPSFSRPSRCPFCPTWCAQTQPSHPWSSNALGSLTHAPSKCLRLAKVLAECWIYLGTHARIFQEITHYDSAGYQVWKLSHTDKGSWHENLSFQLICKLCQTTHTFDLVQNFFL